MWISKKHRIFDSIRSQYIEQLICPRCASLTPSHPNKIDMEDNEDAVTCYHIFHKQPNDSVHPSQDLFTSSELPMFINKLASDIHRLNRTWWIDALTRQPLDRNVGELLMLVTSELSEALEGFRTNKSDNHLPQFPMFEVEIADALIRLLDIAGSQGIDIGSILLAKLLYNRSRADHSIEERLKPYGKKF